MVVTFVLKVKRIRINTRMTKEKKKFNTDK